MPEDTPPVAACYGSFCDYRCTRDNCSFYDSCRYFTTEESRERSINNTFQKKWSHAGEERTHDNEFYEAVAPVQATFPFDFDPDEERLYTTSQVIAIIAFILRLKRNAKIWKILSDRISGKTRSLASYAREEGITRQAMHKRIGKVLAKILQYKCRKIISDARLEKLTPEEFHLYKLQQSLKLPEDYHIILGITPRELQILEESLEHKLYRFT